MQMFHYNTLNYYKSSRTPNPGPVGGFVNDVRPPWGSHAYRSLLKKQIKLS